MPEALKRCGCSVEYLSAVGQGVPDLLVGVHGNNYLFEVKDGNKAASRRKLTQVQTWWHGQWRGHVAVVCSVDDAMEVVGVNVKEATA